MTDIEAELESLPVEPGFMTAEEESLATEIYGAIQDASRWSERGLQSAEFRLGVSDLGYCSERARRMLDQQVPDADVDLLKAFIGTHLGDGIEQAIAKSPAFAGALTQSTVEIVLRGEQHAYTLPGHPDIVLPDRGILLDGKTAFGLTLARRTGFADQQKRFQRHCYGHAAFEAGLFGSMAYEDIQVGNIWMDRAGIEQGLHVKLEPLDTEVIDAAARWLDEVVYAWQHKIEAQKEPAREICATTCGYFRTCREWQTDAVGLLEDPTVVKAVEVYAEGHAIEKMGKAMKEQAKNHLVGVRGSTGSHTVRWTTVNPQTIAATTRKGHDRIEVKPIKKPQQPKTLEAGE